MSKKRGVPEGFWLSCPDCKQTIYRKDAERQQNVCPECGFHLYISARDRIRFLLDEDSFEEWFTEIRSVDPLGFKDRKSYKDRLNDEQKKTLLKVA